MTPKQIANQIALISLADMNDQTQATAAVAMLQRVIPHLRDSLFGQYETAGLDQTTIVKAYSDIIYSTLFPTEFASEDEVSDEDIANDDVSDEEIVDPELEPITAKTHMPIMDAIGALKELASEGTTIRDKGKFIPLDDLDVPEEKVEKEETPTGKAATPRAPIEQEKPTEVVSRRKNVFGKIAAAK